MKVYILLEGEYSDTHIEAVFTDKESAYKLLDYRKKTTNDSPVIEEYDTDVVPVPTPKTVGWEIWFLDNGDIAKIYEVYDQDETICIYDENSTFALEDYVVVNTPDKNKAIKIASDRRAKVLAERIGL